MASVEVIKNINVDSEITDKFTESLDIKSSGWVDVPIVYNEVMTKLPECIKRRINALKNIQLECFDLEGRFYEEAHQLEIKFAEQFKMKYQRRCDIINGLYEPCQEETVWVEPGDEQKNGQKELLVDYITHDKNVIVRNPVLTEDTIGIPGFWLAAMKNSSLLQSMIRKYDEPVLKYLIDIQVKLTGKKKIIFGEGSGDNGDIGFILDFQFAQNDYFTNTSLIKGYAVDVAPDKDDPFSFDGPHIVASAGCHIDWNDGKDVTQKEIKKKQKRKGQCERQFVKTDSFFNFFTPAKIPDKEDEMDDHFEAMIVFDFELGNFLREEFIPKAVLYYTGEATDGDSDSDVTATSCEIIEDGDQDLSSCSDDSEDGGSVSDKDTNQANCKNQ